MDNSTKSGKLPVPKVPPTRVGSVLIFNDGSKRDVRESLIVLRNKKRLESNPPTESKAAARRRKQMLARTIVDNMAGASVLYDVEPPESSL